MRHVELEVDLRLRPEPEVQAAVGLGVGERHAELVELGLVVDQFEVGGRAERRREPGRQAAVEGAAEDPDSRPGVGPGDRHVAAQTRGRQIRPGEAAKAQDGRATAGPGGGQDQLQRAPGIGLELTQMGADPDRLVGDRELAIDRVGPFRTGGSDLEIDPLDGVLGAVLGAPHDRPAVDHGQPARAAFAERQHHAAAGQQQRRGGIGAGRGHLEHRPDQADRVDLHPAAQQRQRFQPQIEPIDRQRAAARRVRRARQGRLGQGQGRLGQELEVDPAADLDRLAGDRLGLLGHLIAVIVPGDQPLQRDHDADHDADQQDRDANEDTQERRRPRTRGVTRPRSMAGRGGRPPSPAPGAPVHARGCA